MNMSGLDSVDVKVPVLLVSRTSPFNLRSRRAELDVADIHGSDAMEEDGESARFVDEGRWYMTGLGGKWAKLFQDRRRFRRNCDGGVK